ncbi:hypothetical protein AQJ64_33320 [Streptomyces griseoruber]|uniref:LamG-like jellyroll fold domain-containing protein n=1 Tax=Streptomyces griseoruber TaxID=1943 RepID=A0A101SPE4_9ACTN|nr:hypothetical protein AQJ64_33320 [Streptomyces griseoruber]
MARGAIVTVTAGAVFTAGLVGLPASGPASIKEAAAVSESEASSDGKALSEETAQAEAAEAGKQVEALNLRTERSETLANPDGTFTLREYVQPVRVFKNGKWASLDTTLVRTANGTWTPKASTADMAFSNGGDGPFATLDRAGKQMSLSWPGGALPEPEVEGSTVTYADVLPDVDLTVTADTDGFSHLLVVKTAEAAENPLLSEISLPVTTQGVQVRTQSGGGLVAVDEGSDGPVFEAAQPQMWDSAGTSGPQSGARVSGGKIDPARGRGEDLREGPGEGSRVSPVKVGFRKGAMVLTPDKKLLKSATYPLYIDPVTKTYTRSGWTMVSSHFPEAEFWKFSDHEGVGRCPADISALCAGPDDRKRQFYAIPTGSLAGKDIIEADFAITLANAYNGTARSVVLSRVNSTSAAAISSATNWSNQPSVKKTITSASTTARAGSCTATNQNLRFNVASAVQQAADSGWATTTFRLASSEESSYAYWNRFCGNGQLEVKYNRLPPQPSRAEMSISPGGKCVTGSARPYVDTPPTMTAVIRDYDHNDVAGKAETLRAEFILTRYDSATAKWIQVPSFVTNPKSTYSDPANSQTGMAKFSAKAGLTGTADSPGSYTLLENVIYAWQVRGSDGQGWGPWSSAPPQACEFILDKTTPAAPKVVSTEYPDDDAPHAGVGDYGTFTFTSTSTDVVSYRYEFQDGTNGSVTAASGTGRPGTLRWAPTTSGTQTLTVTSVDAAGKSAQSLAGHSFVVTNGRAPASAWKLDDPATATAAAGRAGDPPAAKGDGVTFGVTNLGDMKARIATSFNGSQDAHLSTSTPVVDTSKSFSVSLWAYLPELPTRDMTLVSQDGTAEPGFALGYDGATQKWEFRFPDSGMDALGEWRVLDSTKVVANLWVNLAAAYDADQHTLTLYKGGKAVGTPVQRRTSWNATGGLQMGRSLALSGYTNHLKGSLSSVQVYDRLLSAEELATASEADPEQVGYWPLDEATDGVSPEAGGGAGLALSGGASVYQVADAVCDELDPTCTTVPAAPLWGDGHLQLDGTSGFAERGSGLFAAQGSFAVAARARLASADPGKDQTVFALSGVNGQAAVVRYSQATKRWQLSVTDRDAADATVATPAGPDSMPSPSAENSGDHLILAYDAVFGEVKLYVNGQLSGVETLWPNTWDFSTVGIQVGRSLTGSTGSAFFSGALDEVSAYQGVVDQYRAVRISAGVGDAT